MNVFVEEVTKFTVKEVENGVLSNGGLMSVFPRQVNRNSWGASDWVNLTIGARVEHQQASAFSREDLKELIDVLSQIHEAMEENS